jgi:hypothetical protein
MFTINDLKYVVHLTRYSRDLLPEWCIGSSSEEKVRNEYRKKTNIDLPRES